MTKKETAAPKLTYWIVRVHGNGQAWLDGLNLFWTKEEAEDHVHRCEYAEHGIKYEVVENK